MASKVQAREDGRYYSKIVINGVTKIDLTADTVDAAHLLEGFTAHGKTVTPSFSPQTITPDSPDYNYLSQVTVNAIPVQETLNEQGGYTITVG